MNTSKSQIFGQFTLCGNLTLNPGCIVSIWIFAASVEIKLKRHYATTEITNINDLERKLIKYLMISNTFLTFI